MKVKSDRPLEGFTWFESRRSPTQFFVIHLGLTAANARPMAEWFDLAGEALAKS